ncbi:MAG: hypothetical protein LBR26_02435 [Prevotella sp.]|jgi:hypothetical protein|nr:hypothetical protein [Prevotella sp.]
MEAKQIAIEFSKENGFDTAELYTRSVWNGFIVFEAIKKYKPDLSDFPEYLPFVLVKKDTARLANEKESSEITVFYQ